MSLKIVMETGHECTLEKIDNEREGKPEQKSDAAFGTILRIIFFSLEHVQKVLI